MVILQAAKNSILNEKLSFILVKDDNITKPTKEKFLFPFYKAFFIFLRQMGMAFYVFKCGNNLLLIVFDRKYSNKMSIKGLKEFPQLFGKFKIQTYNQLTFCTPLVFKINSSFFRLNRFKIYFVMRRNVSAQNNCFA